MNEALDGARVFLCLAFLTYASWSDLKNREVSNTVWVAFAPLALALTSLQFFLFPSQSWFIYVLSFGATSALSIVLFYAGAWGGADAKALICLSLALPTYPVYLPQPFLSYVIPLFPITIFCNAVLLTALSVFYVITKNCFWKGRIRRRLFEGFERESKWRKVLTILCGYKVETAELEKGGFLYPIEDVYVGDGGETERKLIVMPKDEEREEIMERILNAARRGKLPKEVWVTPGLPFLVFITAGFIVALIFGDILWFILSSAFGMSS